MQVRSVDFQTHSKGIFLWLGIVCVSLVLYFRPSSFSKDQIVSFCAAEKKKLYQHTNVIFRQYSVFNDNNSTMLPSLQKWKRSPSVQLTGLSFSRLTWCLVIMAPKAQEQLITLRKGSGPFRCVNEPVCVIPRCCEWTSYSWMQPLLVPHIWHKKKSAMPHN